MMRMVTFLVSGKHVTGALLGYSGRGDTMAIIVAVSGSRVPTFSRHVVPALGISDAMHAGSAHLLIEAHLATAAGRELRHGIAQATPKERQLPRDPLYLKPIKDRGSPSQHDIPMQLADGFTSDPSPGLLHYLDDRWESRGLDWERAHRPGYYHAVIAPNIGRNVGSLRDRCAAALLRGKPASHDPAGHLG